MKKNIIVLPFCLLIAGCSANTADLSAVNSTALISAEENEKTSEVSASSKAQENILEIASSAEYLGNPEDPKWMYENSECIAIVKVLSAEGRNINEIENVRTFAYTYGKLEVVEVLKSNTDMDKEIEYARLGGTITWDDFLEGRNETSREKLLREVQEIPEYVRQYFEDDIDIETDKVYVAYLNHTVTEDSTVPIEGVYMIEGLAGGLREYSDGKVLNNYTDEWEDLDSLLNY